MIDISTQFPLETWLPCSERENRSKMFNEKRGLNALTLKLAGNAGVNLLSLHVSASFAWGPFSGSHRASKLPTPANRCDKIATGMSLHFPAVENS